MNDVPERKQVALDQLHAWRAWYERRDQLIYAAHLAGASLAEIHDASGVAVNTARSAITSQKEKESVTTAATEDRLAAYHHPNFLAVEPGRFGGYQYTWKPFTGREDEPSYSRDLYEDESLTDEDRRVVYREYDAARIMWATARFHLHARPQVAKMAPHWDAFRQTHTAMKEAFDALESTTDNLWRAQIMKLTDLHRGALKAAEKWDEVSEELAKLFHTYERTAGENYVGRIEDEIAKYGTDTKGWELYYLSEFESSYRPTPTVESVSKEIEHQKTRIREVTALTGQSDA